jgi:hypothetical protein
MTCISLEAVTRAQTTLQRTMNPHAVSPISSLCLASVESGVKAMTTDSDAVEQGYLQKSPPLGKRGLKVCLCTTMSCALFVQRGRVTVHDTSDNHLFVMLRSTFFSGFALLCENIQCLVCSLIDASASSSLTPVEGSFFEVSFLPSSRTNISFYSLVFSRQNNLQCLRRIYRQLTDTIGGGLSQRARLCKLYAPPPLGGHHHRRLVDVYICTGNYTALLSKY